MSEPAQLPAPPLGRRTPRWVAAVGAPFRRAGRWYYYAPRTIQVGLIFVALALAAAGIFFGAKYMRRVAARDEISAAQREYDEAARRSDVAAMITALDKVLAITPGNTTAANRRKSLEALSADQDDPETAAILVNVHLGANRLPEADREAQKVLAKNPSDWKAICVRAHHAFAVDKNPAEARRLIDTLPPPEDPNAKLDVSGLLYAMRLHEAVGRDASSLRSLVVRRLLPHLRGGAAAGAPPGVKAQLLEAYLEPFADPGAAGELAGYWADVSRLAETAVADAVEAGDAAVLIRLGTICQRLRHQALPIVAKHVNLPPDEFAARAKEVDDRTRRAWEKAREKAPDRYEPYIGLAMTEPDPANAVAILQDGLTHCGNQLALLNAFTMLAGQVKDPVVAAQQAEKAAREAKTDPDKWFIFARTARVANRADIAILACKAALDLKKDHVQARLYLAFLLLEKGDGLDARDTLLHLGDDFVFTHPVAAQMYAQGMAEGGHWQSAGDKFAEVLKRAPRNAPPTVPVQFVRGMLAARPKPDQAPGVAAMAAALAEQLRAEWPNDPLAARVRADALFHKAGLTDPPWNREVSEASLRAYGDLSAADRDQPAVVVNIACLQLRGQGDEFAAMKTLDRLHGAETTPLLDPSQAEVVAAVWVADGSLNKRPERVRDAVRLLAQVCTPPNTVRPTPGGTPGCWITLARAQLALRDRPSAANALNQAENWPAPLSARDWYELSQVKSKLRSEQP
jgi:tetratricopeptide (TPR) repeat protein